MKKNLLILAFAAPLLAFGQTAFYMGDGAKVRVQKETLVFTNGDFKVQAGTTLEDDSTNKLYNYGNVKVNGNFTAEDNGNQPTRFVNRFTNGTEYGQLIIQNGTTVNGKITGEYKFAPTSSFNYHLMAFPFVNYSAEQAVSQSGITTPHWKPAGPNKYRYQAPLFVRNNNPGGNPTISTTNDVVNDHVLQGATLSATSAYSVNQYTYPTIADNKHSFIGTPYNLGETVKFPTYDLSDKKNNDVNKYREYYGSYIVDATRTIPINWTSYKQFPSISNVNSDGKKYGSNLYMLGNPYTSNINLDGLLTSNTDIDAVILEESSKYFKETTSGLSNEIVIKKIGYFNFPSGVSVPTGSGIGDQYKVIRPFQVVTLRTKDGKGLNVTFENSYKTFDVPANGAVALTSRVKGASVSNNGVYQVGLDLYVADKETSNRLYVVAADFYQPAGKSEYEAYNDWLGDEVGFYSLQENEDGSIAEELSDQKVYINGINATDYVAKPIHLVFQGKDNTSYTLKVRLNDALLNTKNTFYFEDKKEGKIMEVTPDFEYTFVEPTLNKDRFVMYWNELPETMSIQDVTSSQTQVYKDGENYLVRFAVEFNRADVYVYDLNGRLISAEKSVDASVDHTLPYLSNGKVFIVKVVGDNGVVTSQKIIK